MKTQSFFWHGMTLDISYDLEGGIEEVQCEDNILFLEYLSDYYIDLLQNDFIDYMENLEDDSL